MRGTDFTTLSAQYRIDALRAPLLVSWQLTRDCDLSCVHCCTASAPGKPLPDELNADESLRLADEIIAMEVPYVMLCGGEPFVVPHLRQVAERLGSAGVQLKLETNGQRLDEAQVEWLARLPVRSVQISVDADSPETFARQRPGGSLEKAHAACHAVRAADLPLEVTFAPTRINIHEAGAVVRRAAALGAFRFNTGQLMRIGTAARLWGKLEPTRRQYEHFRDVLRQEAAANPALELCYTPFSVTEGLRASLRDPPATLLILPNGWIKVAAALPHICADLRRHRLADAWLRYRTAWRDEAILEALSMAAEDEALHAKANAWRHNGFLSDSLNHGDHQ